MKLGLNGAVTIGTLDGANVEIREEVGDNKIFIFGHTVEEVHQLIRDGYNPRTYCESDPERSAILDWLGTDHFTPDEGAHVLAPLSVRQSNVNGFSPLGVAFLAAASSRAGSRQTWFGSSARSGRIGVAANTAIRIPRRSFMLLIP
jgi:hypothetical protein